jgi:DNA-directed RNA polymerase specialized sigma24 family protein
VLVARFFEDLSDVETGRLLGCSASTVRSQTHRALARLREIAPELAGLNAFRESVG